MAVLEFLSIFLTGAIGYGSIEMLWRGRTHWTMLLAGGVCFVLIYLIATRMGDRLWKKWLMCACTVTAVEFAVGCLVNLRLGWNVWDYSSLPLDLMGQICPLFSFFWFLLSIPCEYLSRLIYRHVFLPARKARKKVS